MAGSLIQPSPGQVAHLTAASAVTEKFKYRYDLADRKLRCLELSGDITTWGYDAAGQLTRERRSGANAYITTYQYDLTGNQRREQKPSLAITTFSWT